MLSLALLFSLAHADVEYDDPCDGIAEGDPCTIDGDTGECTNGDCIVTSDAPKEDTICGIVGTAALPMVLAALLPALWRRRPA